MDVTYNNVLESTRQYFQGVPPAAAGVGHGGQHPGGGAGLAGLYNIQPNGGGGVGGGGQGQQNGPTANYYHHGGHHQPPSQPQRHLAAVQQQPQSIQPIPSYLTNGGVGGGGKTMYSPSPQPAPSPQENIRMAPNAASKTHYHAHPQASPSPQEHRLPVGSAGKSMYSPHPQSSPSPQENVRLPSSSPFNNLAYANQLQHAQRNRLTPQTPSPLPQAHVKAHPSAPSPGSLSSTSGGGSGVNYQRQVNGGASGGRYGSNYFYHQSLLQQQHELQQQQQQLQQQLQQQQQELKQQLHQQQAFYSGLTNSSQQVPTSQIMQPQRHTSNQYTPVAQPSSRIHNTSSNNAPVDLARTSVNSSTNVASATATNLKRESPLDLSVKTVRQSADSTGHMDNANNNSESGTTYYYFQQEAVRGHHGPNSNSGQQSANYLTSHPNVQPTIAPKVDFSPNFSQHAHILQNHQQHKLPPRQHQSSHQQSTGHFSHHHQSQGHNQSSAQSHSHHQAMMDKQRWKEREAANYPLPSVSSVVKAASAGRSTHQNSGNLTTSNIPGTSGNVNHISGHYQMNQHGQPVLKSAYPAETARFSHNYLKRPVSSENLKASAPTAPKQSRHDTWKDSIDQQIEKRFNSYLSSKGIANGDVNKTSTPVNPQSSYALPPSRNYNYDHHHQMSHAQQQQQQLIQQPQTYPTEKTSTPSHNSGNGAADKRVLSILRNSLETKEARLQQQQMTKSPLQYTELTTRPPAATSYPFAASNRNNLPAFQTGGAQDRNSAPVFQRLSIPKAVDSIQDGNKMALSYTGANHHPLPSHHQAYHPHQAPSAHQPSPMGQRSSGATSCIRPNDVVDITNEEDNSHRVPGPKTSSSSLPPVVMSPQTAANSVSPAIPTSKPAEYDGFAAFIAARIRTKAELKQQPTTDQPSTPAGSSSLTSTSLSSPNFRSPYSNDLVKTPVASSDAYTSNSKCSPWPNSQHKTIKDQPLAASFPRRRLFSKGDEEQNPSVDPEVPPVGALPPASAFLPPRASSSHRSSSETSVFDFRESDSEGEAPTLERQPGRRTSVSSASSAVRPTTPTSEAFYPPTALELELKPIEEETYEEWLTYVDELIGHLEKDKFRRLKSMAKRPSIRGGRAGGRGAVVSSAEQAMTPSHADGLQAVTPVVVKEEVPSTEVESNSNALLRATQPPLEGQLPAVVIKEEALSEPETSQPQTKETSQPELQVSPDIKSEFKEKKIPVNGSKRGGGRGRSRGGGPGSRGGRGGGKSKKTVYGDGSDFKTPGWEEDLYKFKKSLRMPPRLINISRPPGWPKAPLSLPDLEVYPDSPLTNDSVETFPGKSKIEKEDNVKEDEKKSIAKSLGEDQSFLDRLMAKYTARKKKNKKESPCKIEPKGDDSSPELLPTPSLLGSKDPSMLGFRKETIQEYREEFLKTGAFKAEADMPPTILETRTRTENKVFKERLTIREVFGAERPASAPPPGTTTDDLRRRHRLRKNKQKEKKKRMMARANHENRQKGCSGNGGKDDVQSKSKTFRTFRRKLKSSGFDYIRKPKKKIAGPKKKLDNPHKPRKKIQPMTEEEIEELIKSWTLNKGVGETVLHRAAKNGLIDVARYLLDKLEQDPSPRDNAGYTPLHEACSRGHVAVAHLLLNYGASVEDSALGGVRPLHEAAENGFTKLVRLLLDYGADPMLATYSGVTALSLAAADEESRLLMEQHIAQNGSMSSSVHDDLASVPKESSLDGFEVEESHFPLPTLYRLSGESRSDSWILFHELAPLIKVKTKEALCKSLKQESSTIIRDIKLQDFFAKAHSRAIKSAPPTECPNKTPKLTLVKYTAEIKEMLDVETTVIPR